MAMADILSKLKDAKMSSGGSFIKDGAGVFVVRKIFVDKNESGDYFKVVLEVVNSRKIMPEVEPDAPGAVVDYLQLYDMFPKTAPARTAEFLVALTGDTQEACTSADAMGKICGPDQPLRGALVGYSTYRKVAKKSGKVLTLPIFETIKQTPEEVKARRAKLDVADAAKVAS